MEHYPKEPFATGAATLIVSITRALRPKQWTKNFLVYLALFFTINESWSIHFGAQDLMPVLKSTLAFVLFSLISSAIYLVNDIFDIAQDRHHPKKRLRPVASGQLSIQLAGTIAVILCAIGLVSAFVESMLFGIVAAGYVVIMLCYTAVLKRVVLLDVFAISSGFVLRAVAGAVILQVPISPWLYICTGLGALFIALSKRRSELSAARENASFQRSTLGTYTKRFLDYSTVAAVAGVILAYVFYTFTAVNLPDNYMMMLTIPFLVFAVFRYFYLVSIKGLGEAPEDLITSDIPLILSILFWIASASTILAMFRN